MNLDLFLVQKVVQSLLKNDVNATLKPLGEEPERRVKTEKIEIQKLSDCENQENKKKQ